MHEQPMAGERACTVLVPIRAQSRYVVPCGLPLDQPDDKSPCTVCGRDCESPTHALGVTGGHAYIASRNRCPEHGAQP